MNSEDLKLEIQRIYSILLKEMRRNQRLHRCSDQEISDLISDHVKRKHAIRDQIATEKEFETLLQKIKATSRFAKPFGEEWAGFRDFRVCRKVYETEDMCSLYLAPCDSSSLPCFSPGAYLITQVAIRNQKPAIRCYYVANAPNPYYYHIIVERKEFGHVSNFFIDHLQIGERIQIKAPGGRIEIVPSKSYVFVATGFGIAPVLSMLETLCTSKTTATIWVFYGVDHSRSHPFREELKKFAQHPNIHIITCYENPQGQDIKGKDYDYAGDINVELLTEVLPSLAETVFYVFAPPKEQYLLRSLLEEVEIDEKNVFYEVFGAASVKKVARVIATESVATKSQKIPAKPKKEQQKVPTKKAKVPKTQEYIQNSESWLSDDAGRPGPLEWFSVYFVPLLKLAQKTIGLHFVLVVHFFDTTLKVIGNYINSIYYSWRMFWTLRRKQQRQKGSQSEYLVADLFHARILLSKIFHFRGFYLEDFELSESQQQQITSNFQLKEVIEVRRHLEQMRQDLDILTNEQTLQTAKSSLSSFLFSYIPNPFELISAWKDWCIIAFVLRYRREEVEKMYVEFVASYRQSIDILGNADVVEYNNHERKMKERLGEKIVLSNSLKDGIEDNKKKIQRLIYALANPHYLLTPSKWPRKDLLREIFLGQEDNCHTIYFVELERYLFYEIKTALLKEGIKVSAQPQKIFNEHKSFLQPAKKIQVLYRPDYDATVYFAKSNKVVGWDGHNSLLELAEGNDIFMESGCRAGNCHACQVTIKEGTVIHTSDHDELPEGQCLACIAIPKGSITIDA
ncbi:flavin reductase family protein [Candidatus Uabimicrobium amorphum]|uniref:Flavohemoprotein n=1 Tax=Uabimicrobium amorphum TaxID=2596890 RepID=A0A5S9F2H5_UABAM|nr:iron-sulfur cluster-binding domain-containing protein [Candidatus Uabimicrobium amorphum]BBM82122.1 flavohemoprotein [Candidatus Uabimicrobium amorphum]